MPKHAVVLGAGLQGVCVALGLLGRGYRVTLVDQASTCLRRASLRNEGKIHLGFVYANDASLRTSRLMLHSALAFGRLLEEWTGAIDWPSLVSHPFTYCLAEDSMLGRERLLEHYAALEQYHSDIHGGESYLGQGLECLWWLARAGEVSQLSRSYASPLVHTPEVALDLERFCELMRQRLHAQSALTCMYGHRVTQAERVAQGFRVSGSRSDGKGWSLEGDLVVNCLWEGRLAVDQTMGIEPKRRWVHRLKYRLLARLPDTLANLPALTFVLGPYGDIVTYPGGQTYLSYYPECMRGWSDALEVPPEWQAACDGQPDVKEAADVVQKVLAKLDFAVPGIGHSTVEQVDAGAIFTWGSSDIDDPHSELHLRFDTGVFSHDGYFSIDTGKMTCAPLFASELLEKL